MKDNEQKSILRQMQEYVDGIDGFILRKHMESFVDNGDGKMIVRRKNPLKHYDISTDKSTEVNTEVFNHYNTLESKA